MWDVGLVVATISFLGMISPGPDFLLVVKNSLSYPRKYAMTTCLGVVMAVLTHMGYCVAGIAIIIKATPWLFIALRYAGAAYLIWVGVKAILAKATGSVYIGEQVRKNTISYKRAFMQGYFCNLLNPKATLFFLAIFTQVLAVNSTLLDKLWVALIIWVEAIFWWPLVVVVFQSKTIQRHYFKVEYIVDKLLGLLLIVLGISVALSH